MSAARSCSREAAGARSCSLEATGAGSAAALSSEDSVSSAVAITSTPPAIWRFERISVPSPKAMRALARASREVGAVKRLIFMLHL